MSRHIRNLCLHFMKALLILLVTVDFAVIWYNFYAEIDLENMKCTDFWAAVVANNRDIKDGNTEYHFGNDLEIDFEDVFKQISEQEDLEIVKEYALRED